MGQIEGAIGLYVHRKTGYGRGSDLTRQNRNTEKTMVWPTCSIPSVSATLKNSRNIEYTLPNLMQRPGLNHLSFAELFAFNDAIGEPILFNSPKCLKLLATIDTKKANFSPKDGRASGRKAAASTFFGAIAGLVRSLRRQSFLPVERMRRMTMAERPHVTCLMTSSVDGRLHPSCYTASPDGDIADWNANYEQLHEAIGADAWLVGRVTMAEMAKGEPHPPSEIGNPPRPVFRAPDASAPFAVAPDSHARLHFNSSDVGGDSVVVLLGGHVDDAHLAELVADGVSYIVGDAERPDLARMLAVLISQFDVERLALEGGGGINGAMMAAGLVDELHLLVVPALDGNDGRQGIVIAPDGGLKGKAQLSLIGCDRLDHGAVLLRYRVTR